jgi:hypothetical protein
MQMKNDSPQFVILTAPFELIYFYYNIQFSTECFFNETIHKLIA